MKTSRLSYFFAAALLASFSAACGGGGGDDDDGMGMVNPDGTHNQYVLSEAAIPTNANQASMLALNIDGDAQGTPDNALGTALAAVQAQGGLDLQAEVDTAVNAGTIIILADVQATDLSTASGVGTRVFLGDNPTPAPCTDENDTTCGNHLDGSATFDIASDSPDDALLVGQITGGSFSGGPGNVTVEIALSPEAPPLPLRLIGARMEFDVTADQLSAGVLGGALPEDELRDTVLPAVHQLIDGLIMRDCQGTAPDCCTADSTGETLVDLFDASEPVDCEVTLEEFQSSSLISALLASDVDLIDADGNFNPRDDGVKDSVSIGIGFTAVGAVFTRP